MPRYSADPMWLTAKRPGTCECGKLIAKGDPIMWFPRQKVAECEGCGNKTQSYLDDDDMNQLTHAM